MPTPHTRIKNRYEIGELLSENQGICRYRGQDHGSGKPVPVIILWAPTAGGGDPALEGVPVAGGEDEFLPSFESKRADNTELFLCGIELLRVHNKLLRMWRKGGS